MRASTIVALGSLVLIAFGSSALAQEKKGKGLQLTDLPASVQKTVQENLKGGEIKNIGKEKEDGIEEYEIASVFSRVVVDLGPHRCDTLKLDFDGLFRAPRRGIQAR